MTRLSLIAVALALVAVGCSSSTSPSTTTPTNPTFTAALSPANEVPPVTNTESVVTGNVSITIVTTGPNRNVSIAGFTPQSSMSYGSVGSALSGAQRSLSRMGITRPTAEQIQAALIGGEVTLPNGSTTPVRGTVAALGGEQGPVATR